MRRSLVLLILLLAAGAHPAGAEHAWEPLAPSPTPVEGGCDGIIGNKLYVAFGFTFGDSNLLRIYDIDTNTWTSGPPAPTAGRSEMYRGVVHGGSLYCVGGRNTNETWSFEPSTATWTRLADIPDRRVGSTAAVQGNSIFVFGGRDGSTPCSTEGKSPVLRYDIDEDAWYPAGTLVVGRSDATNAMPNGTGRYVYIFGGCDGGRPLDAIEKYDTVKETSVLLPVAMPGGPRSNAAAAPGGPNTIRVTGGHRNSAVVQPNHLIFRVNSETFTIGTPMPQGICPQPNRSEHDLVYHGGRIYAVAGACPAFGTSIANLDVLKLSP